MENKSHAVATGVFVIVVAALLTGLGLWLARDNTDYTFYELSSRESVTGLQPQAAVRYKGVNVGKVTYIGFDPQVSGNVLIRIAVNTDTPISATTYATLGYQGVTGMAHILLDDDTAKPDPRPAPGLSKLPRLPLRNSPLSQLAEQGPAIMGEAQDAMQHLNAFLDDDNQRHFREILERLSRAANSMDALAQRLDNTVATRLDPALAAVPDIAQDARLTLKALHEASNGAAAAIGDMQQTARDLSAAADHMNRVSLPHFDRATDETAQAARRVGNMAADISDNPQSLLYGPATIPPGPGEPGFTAQKGKTP